MATQTRPPPVGAPPSSFASLAPPEFGRLTKNAHDHHADVLAGWPSERPVMVQAGSPPRCLSVLLHDPAAVALFLRTHMKPDELMELILILADAAADVLRSRRAIYGHYPPRQRQQSASAKAAVKSTVAYSGTNQAAALASP